MSLARCFNCCTRRPSWGLDFNFYAGDAQLYLAFMANAAEQTGSIDLIACKRVLVR